MIKLCTGWRRSRARFACLWMLEELGVPYESVKVSFADGGTRKPEFLRVKPNGHIPALDDDGVVLFESFPRDQPPTWRGSTTTEGPRPASAADEGRLYQWSLWAMTELEEPTLTALSTFLAHPPRGGARRRRAVDALERAKKPLGVLDGALRRARPPSRGFVHRGRPERRRGHVAFTRLAKIDLAKTPNVQEWPRGAAGRDRPSRVPLAA